MEEGKRIKFMESFVQFFQWILAAFMWERQAFISILEVRQSVPNTSRIHRQRAGLGLSPGNLTPSLVPVAPDSLPWAVIFRATQNLYFSYVDTLGWPLRSHQRKHWCHCLSPEIDGSLIWGVWSCYNWAELLWDRFKWVDKDKDVIRDRL